MLLTLLFYFILPQWLSNFLSLHLPLKKNKEICSSPPHHINTPLPFLMFIVIRITITLFCLQFKWARGSWLNNYKTEKEKKKRSSLGNNSRYTANVMLNFIPQDKRECCDIFTYKYISINQSFHYPLSNGGSLGHHIRIFYNTFPSFSVFCCF